MGRFNAEHLEEEIFLAAKDAHAPRNFHYGEQFATAHGAARRVVGFGSDIFDETTICELLRGIDREWADAMNAQKNVAGSAKRREPSGVAVAKYLRNHSDASLREIAGAIGYSPKTVGKTKAWRLKMKAQAGRTTSRSDARDSELQYLLEQQAKENAADNRFRPSSPW